MEWNIVDEIRLLKWVAEFKPVGIHKHWHMICILERMNNWEQYPMTMLQKETYKSKKIFTAKAIWNKLRQYYNLEEANRLEDELIKTEFEKEWNLAEKNSMTEKARLLKLRYDLATQVRDFELPWDEYGELILQNARNTELEISTIRPDMDIKQSEENKTAVNNTKEEDSNTASSTPAQPANNAQGMQSSVSDNSMPQITTAEEVSNARATERTDPIDIVKSSENSKFDTPTSEELKPSQVDAPTATHYSTTSAPTLEKSSYFEPSNSIERTSSVEPADSVGLDDSSRSTSLEIKVDHNKSLEKLFDRRSIEIKTPKEFVLQDKVKIENTAQKPAVDDQYSKQVKEDRLTEEITNETVSKETSTDIASPPAVGVSEPSSSVTENETQLDGAVTTNLPEKMHSTEGTDLQESKVDTGTLADQQMENITATTVKENVDLNPTSGDEPSVLSKETSPEEKEENENKSDNEENVDKENEGATAELIDRTKETSLENQQLQLESAPIQEEIKADTENAVASERPEDENASEKMNSKEEENDKLHKDDEHEVEMEVENMEKPKKLYPRLRRQSYRLRGKSDKDDIKSPPHSENETVKDKDTDETANAIEPTNSEEKTAPDEETNRKETKLEETVNKNGNKAGLRGKEAEVAEEKNNRTEIENNNKLKRPHEQDLIIEDQPLAKRTRHSSQHVEPMKENSPDQTTEKIKEFKKETTVEPNDTPTKKRKRKYSKTDQPKRFSTRLRNKK